MDRITVRCGINKKTLRFYVPSPMRDSSVLGERHVEYSDETPEKDWELLSDEGRTMMESLSEVLAGRDDYAIVFDGYTEITLYSWERWKKVLPEVIRVFAAWMGVDSPEVVLASDCDRKLQHWLMELIMARH